MNVGTKQKRR